MILLPLLLLLDAPPQPQADKPLEETKKNIVVLKGVPTSQLIPIMTVMANSLGVPCTHCHEAAWESDAKPAKETARRMIRMTRQINDTNFGGKVVVSCNTCHRGSPRPVNVPLVANAGWNKPATAEVKPELASADEIFTRYQKALGTGTANNRLMQGIATAVSGRGEPRSATFELYQEPPRKSELKMELPYPGEANRGLAYFFDAATLRDRYANVKTIGVDTIRGRNVYVVEAEPKDGGRPERLFFDALSGLLLRRHRETPTLVGMLPEEIDYDDYRTVDGLAVPFLVQWSRADYQVTHRVATVKQNVTR
ncbi:MAG TPA: c-type cytochrome [Thermoanaerobaculia bacterium]|nr:c-type cytochrome [Thermoanaerobaculia bacterium]